MENVSVVVREGEFILDVVKTTLSTERHDQVSAKEYADPTSIVGWSSSWMDPGHDGIESTIGNEHIPDGECLTDQTCRLLDSLLCRRLSAISKFCRHLLFQ